MMSDTWASHPVTQPTASQLPDVCVRGLPLITEARLSPVKVSQVWFRSAQLTHSLMREKEMLVVFKSLSHGVASHAAIADLV